MPSIFDKRRQTGGFARGPFGVGPKSSLNASEMLESGSHFLARFSCSGTIFTPTQLRVLMRNRP